MAGWSTKCWRRNHIGPANACSGSWTTARRIAAQAAKQRLRHVDSRIILVHTPVHASWLNQVEIYFSIIQRKVLTPNDFANLEAIRLRLALYEELSNQSPTPFQWKFDRTKLAALLTKIEARQRALADAQLNCLKEGA